MPETTPQADRTHTSSYRLKKPYRFSEPSRGVILLSKRGDTVVCVASFLRQIILSHILAVTVITALLSRLYACPFRTERTGPG